MDTWVATQRDRNGQITMISSRDTLDALGDGAALTMEACGRCPSPSVKFAAVTYWESRVWHHDIDRSGDLHVEVNCQGGQPKLVVYEGGQAKLEKIYEYPLRVKISLFLVKAARAQVAVDGQVMWTSQNQMPLPTRAHITHPFPQRCRNPAKCTWALMDCLALINDVGQEEPKDDTLALIMEADALPPPGYYISKFLGI